MIFAHAREALHDYDGALQDFNAVLGANPRAARVLLARASLLRMLSDWKGAVADYTTFIEQINAESAFAWTQRASAKLQLEDVQGALADLEVAIYCNALDPNIYTTRARVHAAAGNVDFTNLFVTLSGGPYDSLQAAKDAGAPTINYGMFINTVIDFVIIAFTIFLVIRWFNKMRKAGEKEKPAAAPTTKDCPHCLTSIPIKATRCPACTSELQTA